MTTFLSLYWAIAGKTTKNRGLNEFKGVEGVYVHEFTSGKSYIGQGRDLSDRPVQSLTELLDNTGKHKGTAAKAGDTYTGRTHFIPLRGSGYRSLNELEAGVLEHYGGTMSQGGNTYNIKRISTEN